MRFLRHMHAAAPIAVLASLATAGPGAAQVYAQGPSAGWVVHPGIRMDGLLALAGQQPRAWLGFSYSYQASSDRSVTVTDVPSGSPADHAGLQKGDVVVRINDLAATPAVLRSLSTAVQPGETVRLQVRRGGQEKSLDVVAAKPPDWLLREYRSPLTLEVMPDSVRRVLRVYLDSAMRAVDTLRLPHFEVQRTDSGMIYRFRRDGGIDTTFMRFPTREMRLGMDSLRVRLDSLRGFMGDSAMRHLRALRGPDFQVWSSPNDLWEMQVDAGRRAVAGAEFTTVNQDLGRYFGVSSGLLVTRVASGTPAARAGLQPGDVIVRAGGQALVDVEDLRTAVDRFHGRTLQLRVVRQKKTVELALKLE